ncbi:hypothetical protein GCM10010341_74160 [Streptomyces noursei]|nr:hypothetical protein GCM10010341_74160 [Streptomyces noursei]
MVVAAVPERQAAEAQSVFPGFETGQQLGLFGDHHIPFQACLEGSPGLRQGLFHGRACPGSQGVEAIVQQVAEFLLPTQFLV